MRGWEHLGLYGVFYNKSKERVCLFFEYRTVVFGRICINYSWRAKKLKVNSERRCLRLLRLRRLFSQIMYTTTIAMCT